MTVQVLELTPSTSGWYFASAAAWRGRLFAPRLVTPRLPDAELDPAPALLGYGPDGRLRPTPARPRVWFLA
ncbi:MAG TPA: hypothetical protein VMD08_18280 [Candidatus Baltobacteraceae bacterium]|nr:hypothetical protein [Candidatus Baltobacteraceae bacterium]